MNSVPGTDPRSAGPGPGPTGRGPSPISGSRRSFLKWISGIGAAIVGALTALPALRAFMAPLAVPRRSENWVRLGDTQEFDLEVPVKVDFVETADDAWVEARLTHTVWVYTEDAENFTVYNGRCPHLGCGFAYDTAQKQLICPCHHGRFEPRKGTLLGGPPPRGLDTLKTKVEHGILYAEFRDFRVGIADKIPLA